MPKIVGEKFDEVLEEIKNLTPEKDRVILYINKDLRIEKDIRNFILARSAYGKKHGKTWTGKKKFYSTIDSLLEGILREEILTTSEYKKIEDMKRHFDQCLEIVVRVAQELRNIVLEKSK